MLAAVPSLFHSARAAQDLSVVDWGPPWIDNSKKMAAAWGKEPINWTLHSGGAASILPKIKAGWPNPPYDLVDNWSPVFLSMVREGWAETVTLADCPNLKHIPESLITKDGDGNWKNIPRGLERHLLHVRPGELPHQDQARRRSPQPQAEGADPLAEPDAQHQSSGRGARQGPRWR